MSTAGISIYVQKKEDEKLLSNCQTATDDSKIFSEIFSESFCPPFTARIGTEHDISCV